jgi:deoxycytidylate deaminase
MALAKAARKGESVRGATLYVNLRPCLACLNLALAAGVKSIIYKENWSYGQRKHDDFRVTITYSDSEMLLGFL